MPQKTGTVMSKNIKQLWECFGESSLTSTKRQALVDVETELEELKQAVRDIKLILDKAYSCESHTQIILYIGQCLLNIERIIQEGEKDAVN